MRICSHHDLAGALVTSLFLGRPWWSTTSPTCLPLSVFTITSDQHLFRLYYFAGPMQLSLLSKCKRYILNTSLMLLTATRLLPKCKGYILNDSPLLRTFGHTRYTLKVAFLLNVRAVSPQSHPRCMVNQPTFETVKVPIMIVFLSFANHPTPRTVSSTPMCSHSALHPA